LRMELDRIPLWRGEHVGVKQLAEDFAKYLYLPRLKDSSVLTGAIASGVATLTWEHDTFAYAEGYDEAASRYRGLIAGQHCYVLTDGSSVLVKPEAARRQLDRDVVAAGPGESPTDRSGADNGAPLGHSSDPTGTPVALPSVTKIRNRRFHGTVSVGTDRLGRDAGTIAENVVQHLALIKGAKVRITLEIEAEFPEGAPDSAVRTVTENCHTLKFDTESFEDE